MPIGETLPERCIRCNEPAVMDAPRRFTWHHPGWYLLLLLAILIYVVVALIVRKNVRLAVGLCSEHRRRRRQQRWLSLGLLAAGVAGFVLCLKFDAPVLGWFAGLSFVAALLTALRANRSLSPTRIDDESARFRGCGEAFLDSLPQE